MRRESSSGKGPGRRLVALVLLVTSAGCYSYVPVEDPAPEIGEDVRVHVTGEAVGTLRADRDETRRLQGMVIGSSSDSLTLAFRSLRNSPGARPPRDTVTLALADVQRLERSKMDILKTGALVVGTLGLAAGAAILAESLGTGGSGDFGDGGDAPRLIIELSSP